MLTVFARILGGMGNAPIAVVFLGLVMACQSLCDAGEKKPAVFRITTYDYALPAWWETVKVDVPKDLKDEEEVRNYVRKRYGNDTGTKETWKEALKTWAIASQRHNIFPVYLAHCHQSGEDYKRAAEIYADLYKLADTQKDERDWYRVYMAFNAGKTFELLKDTDKAVSWYSRAAEYVGNKDEAIADYARQSADKAKQLKKK